MASGLGHRAPALSDLLSLRAWLWVLPSLTSSPEPPCTLSGTLAPQLFLEPPPCSQLPSSPLVPGLSPGRGDLLQHLEAFCGSRGGARGPGGWKPGCCGASCHGQEGAPQWPACASPSAFCLLLCPSWSCWMSPSQGPLPPSHLGPPASPLHAVPCPTGFLCSTCHLEHGTRAPCSPRTPP